MTFWARCLAVLVLLAAGLAVARAQSRVTPPNPGELDPTVRAAVAELTAIVERRDLAAFKRHLRADTTISFGGDYGPEGLDMVWSPDRADTTLWIELAEILRLGGVQRAGEDDALDWCAPWPSCIDLPADGSAFDLVIVTGTDVAIRARPDLDAPVLGRVSRIPLVLTHEDSDPAWHSVRWGERTGYVRQDLARSPVDQRITLRVERTGWKVLYFVAGD